MPKPRTFINVEELSEHWNAEKKNVGQDVGAGNYTKSRYFELEIMLAQTQQITVLSHNVKELCKMMAELTLAVQNLRTHV